MRSIDQIQQWADWASNHDAAEESILTMMHTLLDEVKRLNGKLAGEQESGAELVDEVDRLHTTLADFVSVDRVTEPRTEVVRLTGALYQCIRLCENYQNCETANEDCDDPGCEEVFDSAYELTKWVIKAANVGLKAVQAEAEAVLP